MDEDGNEEDDDIAKGIWGTPIHRNAKQGKIQPQQNKQYLMQIPTQTLQCHRPKKLQKLQQHQDRMTKTGPTTLTRTPLITTTKVWTNLAPANQLNNLPLCNES